MTGGMRCRMKDYTQFVSVVTLVSLFALRTSGFSQNEDDGDGGADGKLVHSENGDNGVGEDDCRCGAVWNPVCGTNDQTYWNEGCAKCADVEIACPGRCPCNKSCDCPAVDHPVCGVNHVTYRNNCFANCEGMPARCYGRCPCACTQTVAICDADPCSLASSELYPDAQCFPDYCGGCIAHFVVEGKIVDSAPSRCSGHRDAVTSCVLLSLSVSDGRGRDSEIQVEEDDAFGVASETERAYHVGSCKSAIFAAKLLNHYWRILLSPTFTETSYLMKLAISLVLCLSVTTALAQDMISARDILCSCAADGIQVCATDGMEYPNKGCGFCEGYQVACEGPCPCDDCPCPLDDAFVCGVDGVTYRNRCFAACSDMPIGCDGECPCPCDSEIQRTCDPIPCRNEECPAFPDARCFPSLCGKCASVFVADGNVVNCDPSAQDSSELADCLPEGDMCNALLDQFPEDFPDDKDCCLGLTCCRACASAGGDASLTASSVDGVCLSSCPACD